MDKAAPVWALVAAAGQGRRLGLGYNKQFARLGGLPMLTQTLRAITSGDVVDQVVVLVGAGEEEACWQQVINPYGLTEKIAAVISGGAERQDSVVRGLEFLTAQGVSQDALVLIHDGARPFVTAATLSATVAAARETGAAVAAVPAKDTLKLVDEKGRVTATIPRAQAWVIQTPQVFRFGVIWAAHQKAQAEGFYGTDDAMLVEHYGGPVQVVKSAYQNFKITTPEDLISAQAFCSQGEEKTMRVGIGYDVHQFSEGRPLVLGGVEIPWPQGLAGHSDADVLIHAVLDALLGAISAGDIGKHFPPSAPQFKDISSLRLLTHVRELLSEGGFGVGNIDVVVAAEQPKLAPYIEAMRRQLATTLQIKLEQVSIKATTTEGLGFTGRGEGIAAWAVANVFGV